MRTIHRYPLRPGMNTLVVPEGAQRLSAHSKDGEPQIWLLVDTTRPAYEHRFYVAATGEDLDAVEVDGALPKQRSTNFVGTVFVRPVLVGFVGPTLVFHVFDCGRVQI